MQTLFGGISVIFPMLERSRLIPAVRAARLKVAACVRIERLRFGASRLPSLPGFTRAFVTLLSLVRVD